jgi:hypothetical protein
MSETAREPERDHLHAKRIAGEVLGRRANENEEARQHDQHEAADHPRLELSRQPVERPVHHRHAREPQIQDENRRKKQRQPHQMNRLSDRHPILAVADEDND